MKKLILLCAVIGVSQLHGMQSLSQLPREAQVLIVQALTSGNNVEDTVKAIKNVSLVSKPLNYIINEHYSYTNLRQFTALMDLLASKFPGKERIYIATLFGGSIANEYIQLGMELFEVYKKEGVTSNINPDFLTRVYGLLEQGADPNFTMDKLSVLLVAIKNITEYQGRNAEKKENLILAIRFLLENGANPNAKLYSGVRGHYMTVIDYLEKTFWANDREELLELLKPYA